MIPPDRQPLLDFFENISDYHLRELFSIVHEVKNCLDYETESEKITMEILSTLLWKVTEGVDLIDEGKNRK